jgi:hypothetical protein
MRFRKPDLLMICSLSSVIPLCSCNRHNIAAPEAATASQTITATADADGNPHPASVGITKPATVTCISAIGGPGSPASCTINGQIVNVNNSVGATTTVYLTCNGSGALRCSARISQ